jgi:hypothetical protein
MDGFVRVTSGVVSPLDFFSEGNVQRIFASVGGGEPEQPQRSPPPT